MSRHRLLNLLLLVGLAFPTVARADGDDGLTTINNPGGGQIVYGPLTKVSSLKDAMVYMLRTVHTHFGDRPQIGKFFRARDSHSIATFFTVNEKRRAGVTPVSGLVIISDGSPPAAAVLYDDSARFRKTAPAMIQKLGEVWRVSSTPAPDTTPPPPTAAPDVVLNVARAEIAAPPSRCPLAGNSPASVTDG